jgi:hypothetical protein
MPKYDVYIKSASTPVTIDADVVTEHGQVLFFQDTQSVSPETVAVVPVENLAYVVRSSGGQ